MQGCKRYDARAHPPCKKLGLIRSKFDWVLKYRKLNIITDPRFQILFLLGKIWKVIKFIISITNVVHLLSLKFLKRQLDRDYADVRLRIGKKI